MSDRSQRYGALAAVIGIQFLVLVRAWLQDWASSCSPRSSAGGLALALHVQRLSATLHFQRDRRCSRLGTTCLACTA